jgi:hypothetical protein
MRFRGEAARTRLPDRTSLADQYVSVSIDVIAYVNGGAEPIDEAVAGVLANPAKEQAR